MTGESPSGCFAALAAFARGLLARGERGVLAHLVEVEGSHYRRPGARMILAEHGAAAGSVSGGCLETELRRRVPEVLTGGAILVEYDLSRADDVVFGSGLGCGGRIAVLLTAIGSQDVSTLARAADGAPCILETVYRSAAPSAPCGRRRFLEHAVGGSAYRRLTVPDGFADVFLEPVGAPPVLLVAGAGADLVPLARIGGGLGWRVEIVVPRLAEAHSRRWAVILDAPIRLSSEIESIGTDTTAAVVATHHYLDDVEILRALRRTRARYIGLLGSRRRVARMLEDTRDVLDPIGERRIHGPAGLDLGAETPEEIALSIAAEIQAVFRGRRGGPLREGSGALHDRSSIPVESLQEPCDRSGPGGSP